MAERFNSFEAAPSSYLPAGHPARRYLILRRQFKQTCWQ